MTDRQRHLVAYVIGAVDGALLAYITILSEIRRFPWWWVPIGAVVGLIVTRMLFPPPRRRDG